MADLKQGSQVGGNLIWHKGILPLNSTDTQLFYQDKLLITDSDSQTISGAKTFTNPDVRFTPKPSTINTPLVSDTRVGFVVSDNGSSGLTPNAYVGILGHINYDKYAGVYVNAQDGPVLGTVRLYARVVDNGTETMVGAVMEQGTQTINGVKTFSANPLSSATQSTNNSALTRRDFVIAQDALKVSKTGDTMTGALLLPTNTNSLRGAGKSADSGIYFASDGRTIISGDDNSIQLRPNGSGQTSVQLQIRTNDAHTLTGSLALGSNLTTGGNITIANTKSLAFGDGRASLSGTGTVGTLQSIGSVIIKADNDSASNSEYLSLNAGNNGLRIYGGAASIDDIAYNGDIVQHDGRSEMKFASGASAIEYNATTDSIDFVFA